MGMGVCNTTVRLGKYIIIKVSKSAKIRNRYNQVPHLTQDTNGKVTNKAKEVSPFPAGDHKAHINRRAQRHSKHKTEKTHKHICIHHLYRVRTKDIGIHRIVPKCRH